MQWWALFSASVYSVKTNVLVWEQPGAVAVKMYSVLVVVRFLVKASLRGELEGRTVH